MRVCVCVCVCVCVFVFVCVRVCVCVSCLGPPSSTAGSPAKVTFNLPFGLNHFFFLASIWTWNVECRLMHILFVDGQPHTLLKLETAFLMDSKSAPSSLELSVVASSTFGLYSFSSSSSLLSRLHTPIGSTQASAHALAWDFLPERNDQNKSGLLAVLLSVVKSLVGSVCSEIISWGLMEGLSWRDVK